MRGSLLGAGFGATAFRTSVTMSLFVPAHLSVSSVELYAACPARWKRRYVDRVVDPPSVPMAWGTAFHKALEAAHSDEPDADCEQTWVRTWNAMRETMGPSFLPGKAHGIELLEGFRSRGLAVTCPAEVKFVLPFPGGRIVHPKTRRPIPLLGYVDAFAPDDTREYKTTGKGSNWTETKAQLAHQTHVYGWVRQRTRAHRRPVRYVIFNTRVPVITEYVVEPSPDGFRVFEQLAEAVWDGIVNERFDGCGACDLCAPPANGGPAGEFSLEDI